MHRAFLLIALIASGCASVPSRVCTAPFAEVAAQQARSEYLVTLPSGVKFLVYPGYGYTEIPGLTPGVSRISGTVVARFGNELDCSNPAVREDLITLSFPEGVTLVTNIIVAPMTVVPTGTSSPMPAATTALPR